MSTRIRDYVSVPQAQRETGLRRAIARAVKSGDLASYRFDAWRRIRRVDLTAWLARHRSEGPER